MNATVMSANNNTSSPSSVGSHSNNNEIFYKNHHERKLKLLEERMAGTDILPVTKVVNPPINEEKTQLQTNNLNNENHLNGIPVLSFFVRPSGSDITVSTVEDNLPSPTEIVYGQQNSLSRNGLDQANPIIVIDSSSNGSRSQSNHNADWMKDKVIGEKRPRGDEDSRGGGDSVDRPKSPKLKHGEEPDNSPNQGDNGSRGAATVPKQRDIKTYFTLHNNSAAAASSNNNLASSSDGSSGITSIVTTTSSTMNTNNSGVQSLAELSRATATTTPSNNNGKSAKAQAKEKEKDNAQPVKDNSVFDLKKQLDQVKTAKDQLESKLLRTETELKIANDRLRLSDERNKKNLEGLEDIHRKTAMQEFRRKREKLALDSVRLGKISTVRNGPGNVIDVFEEGYAGKDLNRRFTELLRRKEELEARKKRFNNLKRQVKKSSSNNANNLTESELMELNTIGDADMDLDIATEAEVIRSHQEQLKRDESALAEEKRLLESEKAVHTKELKRCQCEERSRFYRDLPLLNKRYLLLCMLGRGGFSEVWKALDILELKEVAVKVHQLNPDWKDERKAAYVKHVTREYTIHRDMKHPRVVQLFDVFEIDMNSFATVLEYCKGIDLDERLKRQRNIPEKDARAIFMQIMSGLRYLAHPFSYNFNGLNESINGGNSANNNNNEGEEEENSCGASSYRNGGRNSQMFNKKLSIIHYDLKPANILFDENGDVKITDFGLAKVMDDSEDGTSMELTSQGAGTYWYLPPECFVKGARISSKVDVWSAGVIFFQMLYGIRPFGEGQSQENIWTEGTILNANMVNFPTDPKAPKVSEEAKELIRRCLEHDYHRRPDVNGICQDPYLKNSK